MLLVVFDHSMVPSPGPAGATPMIDGFMQSMVPFFMSINMPLVFFISGSLYAITWPTSSFFPSAALLNEKARRLLFPYLVISSMVFPIKGMLGEYARRPVDFSVNGYFVNLIYPWANSIIYFWFLPTLFLMFLFAPMMRHCSNRMGIAANLVVTALMIQLFLAFEPGSPTKVLPFNWTGVLHYLLFFWCGIWLGEGVVEASQSTYAHFAAGIGCLAMGASVCIFNLIPEISPPWLLAMNVLGIIAVVSFSIGTQGIAARPIDVLARNSYQIFLFSWFFHQAVILLSKTLPGVSVGVYDLLSLCVGLLGPLAVAYAVRTVPHPWIQLAAGIKPHSPAIVREGYWQSLQNRASPDVIYRPDLKTASQ